MRLFVAVNPPPSAVQDLELAVEHASVAGPRADLRWVPASAWHLTLAFLGDVAESRLDDLSARLARVAGRHPSLPARIAGAGTFGSRSRARVLWAGIDSDRRALRRLADSVAAAARRAGVDLDSGRFKAHLTLARTRQPIDLTEWVAALADYRGQQWPIDQIRLVSSALGAGPAGRPAHETVGSWRLGGG